MTNSFPQQSSVGPTDVGPYRLVRMIGEGGMGAVYYALRRSDNLAVALKILPRSLAMDSDQLARFRREAAVAMGLDHPNVVGCIDVDQADGYNFMVMEFVGGGDAEELLRRSGGRISERRAMSVALDITKALHHASSFGLVHRDIKPENLLFTESGLAKLTDFGLVKRTAENLRITERGKAMGTPHFMAPEQARGKRDLDVRSDIYSLGSTIYYLLSGRTPYNGNSAFEIVSQLASEPPPPLISHRPDLSPSCLFIIECMMTRELEDRPQSAKDLLVMIEAYFNGRPIPHPRELTKPEKGQTEMLSGERGKAGDANPLKKLKAAEFQATPREAKRAEPAHEPPANALTRHFLGSPTRIIAKGAAPPPPPSPESVSMPSMGTTVPLIRQNADARKPALAQSSSGPGAPPGGGTGTLARGGPGTASILRGTSGDQKSPGQSMPAANHPPQAYPPQQPLPMGIPLGGAYNAQGLSQEEFGATMESGEQITADLDMPLPAVHFPPTPPAGVVGIVNQQSGMLPPSQPPQHMRTARPDTGFFRRDTNPPPPTAEQSHRNAEPESNPYESGELITEEPPSGILPPAEALRTPQGPGPVTSRFAIQTPPPEAYLPPSGAHPTDDGRESGELLAEESSAGDAAAVDTGSPAYTDAETPPPEAYLDSPEGLPQPREVEGDGRAADGSADLPAEAAVPEQYFERPLPGAPTSASSGLATPVPPNDPPQPDLQTSPEQIERIALTTSSAANPAIGVVEVAGGQDRALLNSAAESLPQAPGSITPPSGVPNAPESAEAAAGEVTPEEAVLATDASQAEAAATADMPAEVAREAGSAIFEANPGSPARDSEAPAAEQDADAPGVDASFTNSAQAPLTAATIGVVEGTAVAPVGETPAGTEQSPVELQESIAPAGGRIPTPRQASATGEAVTPESGTGAASALPLSPEAPADAPIDFRGAVVTPPAAGVVGASSSPRVPAYVPAPMPGAATVTGLPALAAEAPAASKTTLTPAEYTGIDADSLLARVRRLNEADTMLREVPDAGLNSASRPQPAASSYSWPPFVLGFIGGVIVAVILVVIVMLMH